MKKFLVIVVVVAIAALAAAYFYSTQKSAPITPTVIDEETRPVSEETVALVGAKVFDGKTAPQDGETTIIVKSGRIEAIGPQSSVAIPPDATVVDYTGKWILPGLIDAHSHVLFGVELPRNNPSLKLFDLFDVHDEPLRQYLAAGVTTVASLGTFDEPAFIQAKEAVKAGEIVGPNLLLSFTLTNENGHGTEFGAEVDWAISDLESMRLALDELEANRSKYDLIKVAAQRGMGRPFEEGVQKAIVERAHELGLPVIFHRETKEATEEILSLGPTAITHAPLYSEITDEMLDIYLEQNIAQIPTAHVLGFFLSYDEAPGEHPYGGEFYERLVQKEVLDELEPDVFYQNFRELIEQRDENILRAYEQAGISIEIESDESFMELRARMTVVNIKKLKEKGITFGVGSDAPLQGSFFGTGVHDEIRFLVTRHGLTELEALTAATYNNAQILGVAEDYGSLEPGKIADMIVLDGNPFEDIMNTRALHRVIKGGDIYDPADIMDRRRSL